jgi:hypothetical protein
MHCGYEEYPALPKKEEEMIINSPGNHSSREVLLWQQTFQVKLNEADEKVSGWYRTGS